MKNSLILFFLLILNISSFSQSKIYIDGGLNLSWVKVKNHFMGDDLILNPGFGFHSGITLNTTIGENWFFKSRIAYDKRNIVDRSIYTFTDQNGSPVFDLDDHRIRNNYINLTFQGFYKISENFSFGIGPSLHYLLYSRVHIPFVKKKEITIDQEGTKMEGVIKNDVYKTLSFSIPITLQFEINRILTWVTFDKGIMNEYNNNNKVEKVKQYRTSILIGVGYRISKNKS